MNLAAELRIDSRRSGWFHGHSMRVLCRLAFLCLLSACASAPAPKPLLMPATHHPALPQVTRVELVSAPAVTPADPPRIGQAHLDEARALLQQARNELEPQQWALLNGKLTEAERAWERFSTAARASGRAAEIARGAEGVAEAGRVGERVSLEIEAARKRSGGKRPSEGASLPRIEKKAWDPAPDTVPENWVYPPGKRLCDFKGAAEPSKVGRPDRVRCTYDCGGRTEVRYYWGTSREVCLDPFRRPMY